MASSAVIVFRLALWSIVQLRGIAQRRCNTVVASQTGFHSSCTDSMMQIDTSISQTLRSDKVDGLGEVSAIHVAYATTSGSFAGLLASMISVAKHLEPHSTCTFHIFTPRSDTALVAKVVECFLQESLEVHPEVLLYETQIPSAVADFINASVAASGSVVRPDLMVPETFVRVYLHEYLPGVSRVLWLDTDTIVQHNVAELYMMQMKHALGCVTYGGTLGDYVARTNPSGGISVSSPDSLEFNTGVLLLDLDQWRNGSLTRQVEVWMRALAGQDTEAEQMPLNLALEGRFDAIDQRWNLVNLGLTEDVLKLMWWDFVSTENIDSAWILHWTGASKPWLTQVSNHYQSYFSTYDRRASCSALR